MALSRETRLQIMLDEAELERIDVWRFQQHMPSRAAAIRRLLQIALNMDTLGLADPAMRSRDFSVLRRGDDNSEGE